MWWLRVLAVLVLAVALGHVPGVPVAADRVDRLLAWTGSTPPLELNDLAGKTHTLEDYRGRVVLVNFWATWCGPCLDEMPSLRKLQDRMAGRPFTLLAVNHGESPARIESFLQRVGIDLHVLLDRNRQVSRAWRVRILPASVLVDGDGRARYHVIGELDWTADDAVAAVQRLMGEHGAGDRPHR